MAFLWLGAFALGTALACSEDVASTPHTNPATAGAAGVSGASGNSGSAGNSGSSGNSGTAGAAGATAPPPSLADVVEMRAWAATRNPRPAYGALLAVNDGERVYTVESRRDVEAGPFGLPWRSRFRVAAYDGEREAWAFDAEPDDVIGDVVVHPSGEVTVALERFPPESSAFQLVRLTRTGDLLGTTTLASPTTIPDSDYAATDPRPLFRMKSDFADATVAGWLRLLPDGEGLTAAFLSFIALPASDPSSTRTALGLAAFDWQAGAYAERWAHVVEGPHAASPAVWTYDELRWREQAIRPFLARDDSTGDLLVGRAWNQTRCEANRRTFAEFPAEECVLGAVGASENELLPLAVTRFDASGARLGTRILRIDADAAEQVPFALAARDGELAVAGSVVRQLADGSKKTYPDPSGYVDYDGYLSVYDADGALLRSHDYDLGHGDVLAALRWTEGGIVAIGSSGWDRWQGGMSISRGASPVLAWLSQDGADARQRLIPLADPARHFNLHDVVVTDRALVGYGFSDAPMTHSADGGDTAARTFGSLAIRLER